MFSLCIISSNKTVAKGNEEEYLAMIPNDQEIKDVIMKKEKTPHVWYSFHNLVKHLLSAPRGDIDGAIDTEKNSSIDSIIQYFLNFIKEDYEENYLKYKERFTQDFQKCFDFLSAKNNLQYFFEKSSGVKIEESSYKKIKNFLTKKFEDAGGTKEEYLFIQEKQSFSANLSKAIEFFLLSSKFDKKGWMKANIFVDQYTIYPIGIQIDGRYSVGCAEIPNDVFPKRKLKINHEFGPYL